MDREELFSTLEITLFSLIVRLGRRYLFCLSMHMISFSFRRKKKSKTSEYFLKVIRIAYDRNKWSYARTSWLIIDRADIEDHYVFLTMNSLYVFVHHFKTWKLGCMETPKILLLTNTCVWLKWCIVILLRKNSYNDDVEYPGIFLVI